MRKQKTIKIDDKEITIRELRIKDILEIIDNIGEESFSDIQGQIETFLPRVTDIKMGDLRDMAPSEIMGIYDAFREVNRDFFDIARSAGLDKFLANLKASILKDFSESFADSLKQVTGRP